MAFVTGTVDNVFFVRWLDVEPGDVAKVCAQVKRAKNSVAGPLVYLAIVPADARPPDDTERKALTAAIPQLLTNCCCLHLIIEGQGFKQAAVRMIASGMFLV